MKRWQMTTGLAACAVAALMIAPRLHAAFRTDPLPTEEPPEQPAQVPLAGHDGHLEVDVTLDQAAVLRGQPSERFVTVEVSAPMIGAGERRPVDLAVVLDTSGSMDQGKLERAKAATRQLARQLGPDDTLAIVAFAGQPRVVRGAAPVTDPTRVDQALEALWHHGGTNLYGGIAAGAESVTRRPGAVQRVLVLTDGEATEGELRVERFERMATELSAAGVSLSTVGLGATYNEDLLARLADLGGGHFEDVAGADELAAVFDAELAHAAAVIARDTWVTVDLPEGVEPLELVGWSGQRTANGWRVYLGDVFGGERRKLVLRVRVDATVDAVLAGRADYRDLLDDRQSVDVDTASLTVTDDPRRVASSVDAQASAAAQRAWGHRYLDMATRAYAEGDVDASERHLRDGRAYLESSSVPAAQLRDDLDAFEAAGHLPSQAPAEAARQIKASKERFRAVSR